MLVIFKYDVSELTVWTGEIEKAVIRDKEKWKFQMGAATYFNLQ